MNLHRRLAARAAEHRPVRVVLIGAGKFRGRLRGQGDQVSTRLSHLDAGHSADVLSSVVRPVEDGGALERASMVEVVSSLERDGRPVERDLRWGVFVVFRAPTPYAADCFRQYGLVTWDDVEPPADSDALRLRCELELLAR